MRATTGAADPAEGPPRPLAINISAAIISTLVKYPTDSCSFDKDSPELKRHKLGYFAAEQETFAQIARTVGTAPVEGEAAGRIARHPLTYLLEAADDIAYATADLEDAFKKGLFTLDAFISFYRGSYQEPGGHGTLYKCSAPAALRSPRPGAYAGERRQRLQGLAE